MEDLKQILRTLILLVASLFLGWACVLVVLLFTVLDLFSAPQESPAWRLLLDRYEEKFTTAEFTVIAVAICLSAFGAFWIVMLALLQK